MRIHALLFSLILGLTAETSFALYGARPAGAQNFLVKLQINQETFCQGVVIAPDKVLTAGHCIEGMGWRIRENAKHLTYYPDLVSVRAGTLSVKAKYITFAETMFDSHGVLAEDLALIELSSPLKNVQVLPFASKSDLKANTTVTLSSDNKEAAVKILRTYRGDQSFVIMTDGSVSGICQGDSGGALLLTKNGKKYLAGVLAARAEGCARRNSVSYFPRRSI